MRLAEHSGNIFVGKKKKVSVVCLSQSNLLIINNMSRFLSKWIKYLEVSLFFRCVVSFPTMSYVRSKTSGAVLF